MDRFHDKEAIANLLEQLNVVSSNEVNSQGQENEPTRQVEGCEQVNEQMEVASDAAEIHGVGGNQWDLSETLREQMYYYNKRMLEAQSFQEKKSLYLEFKGKEEIFNEFVKKLFSGEREAAGMNQSGNEARGENLNSRAEELQNQPHHHSEDLNVENEPVRDDSSSHRHFLPVYGTTFNNSETFDQSSSIDQLYLGEGPVKSPFDLRILFFEHINQTCIHATMCEDEHCDLAPCRELKLDIQHVKTCASRRRGCPRCRKVADVTAFHALGCSKRSCKVPYCLSIHRRTAEERRRQPKMIRVGRRLLRNPARPSLPFLCSCCSTASLEP